MNTNEKRDFSVTTFSTVVVHKDELLKTLEVNRAKHNSIYDAAVSGYWEESKRVLAKKQDEFKEAVDKANQRFSTYQERLLTDFAYQATGIASNIEQQNKDKAMGFGLSQQFSYSIEFAGAWPLKYPENHLEDYDRVIDMLKYSVADKVELSSQDFDAYVRNNWSWRNSFLSTNTNYLTGSFISFSGYANAGHLISASGCSPSVVSVTGGTYAHTYNQLSRAF